MVLRLFTLFLLFQSILPTSFAQEASSFVKEIRTVEDLQNINDNLAGDYILVADLDMGGVNFTPIGIRGTDAHYFVGTFNGNNRVIKNLQINMPEHSYVGLFAANRGVIENLVLADIQINGAQNVGPICGYNDYRQSNVGYILNCHASGKVGGKVNVGGLVGQNNSLILLSSSRVSVGSECDMDCGNLGGLVGLNSGSGHIAQSYSMGDVTGNDAGGLVGTNYGNIGVCYSSGNVSTSSDYETTIGGLVGYHMQGIISQCYTISVVRGNRWIGGLIGFWSPAPGAFVNNNCYFLYRDIYKPMIEDPDIYFNIAGWKYENALKQPSTYVGWDFENMWIMDSSINGGYPSLVPYTYIPAELHFLAGNSPLVFENVYVDDVDEPLRFVSDPELLKNESLYTSDVKGFVADGVTPLMIKMELSPGEYSLSFVAEGLEDNSVLESRLRIYNLTQQKFIEPEEGIFKLNIPSIAQAGLFGNPEKDTAQCFAYIDGIECSQLGLKEGYTEATCEVAVRDVVGGIIGYKKFSIRKPPIVLVHGLDGSAKTWYEDYEKKSSNFIDRIVEGGWHRDFVQPVEYGVDANGNGTLNLLASLRQNATWLDQSLVYFEDRMKLNWAMTRYYYVGHSQGGVISRYFCQRPSSVEFSFRNNKNFMRGRFYRIITIGAPHNGAQVERYCLDLSPYDVMPGVSVLPFCTYLHKIQKVITGKFDPWGKEIKQLNSLLLDEHAKYHLFITQVGNAAIVNVGLFPSQDYFEYMYPTGWDGIVEYESARAGMSDQYITYFASDSIAHTGDIVKKKLVKADEEQTQSIKIASKISEILCLDNKFGMFVTPSPASNVVLEKMRENLIYAIILSRESNYVFPFKASRSISENYINSKYKKYLNLNLKQISANRWSLEITINKDHPPMGEIMFVPFVYGPEGLTQNGVSVQSNPAQGNQAIVTVDEDVIGDVVIYPRYFSVDGKWVFYEPVFITTLGENYLSSIKISDTIKTLLLGQSKSAVFYGVTNQGVDILLFPKSSDKIEIISSDPTILEVTERQTIRAKKTGTATLTIRYNDLEASETITVVPAETPNPDWDRDGKIDANDLFRFANYWMTDETDYDLSNNGLVDQKDLLFLHENWHR